MAENVTEVVRVELSDDNPVTLWLQLGQVLGFKCDTDLAGTTGVMNFVAELFCRHPEQMYAWWQVMKATDPPLDEAALVCFGEGIGYLYERGLMRPEVAH